MTPEREGSPPTLHNNVHLPQQTRATKPSNIFFFFVIKLNSSSFCFVFFQNVSLQKELNSGFISRYRHVKRLFGRAVRAIF